MNTDGKPKWMSEHEASDQRNFDDIRNALQRIEIKLDPIYDNYESATKIAKLGMGLAVFGSVILGILLSIKTLFGK